MKIVPEVVLVAKDIPVYLELGWYSNPPCKRFTVSVLGAKATWSQEKKMYECWRIASPKYSWMHLFECNDTSQSADRFTQRNDAMFADTIEELAMNLQLQGEKNVFEIPKNVLLALEKKSDDEWQAATSRSNEVCGDDWRKREQYRNYCERLRSSFRFPFKILKDKCKRLF